jgi:hypothetical protein
MTNADDRGAACGGIATLVRSIPIRLVELSEAGCRVESAWRVEAGTSGLMAVELAGLLRIDDVRVARCQLRLGAGAVYQLGVELLHTKRLGRRSLRSAMRNITRGELGVGHALWSADGPPPPDVRTEEAGGRFESRAPPERSDNGP